MASEWDVASEAPVTSDWGVSSEVPAAPSEKKEVPKRTGFREQAAAAIGQGPVEIEAQQPSTKEQYKQLGKGIPVGALSGALSLYDIPAIGETLVRAGARKLGADVSPEPAYTAERVGTALFGPPKSEYEKSARYAGTLVAPFASQLAKRGAVATGEALAGRPGTQLQAEVAREAEAMNLPVKAKQVRGVEPKDVPLSVADQRKVTSEITKETGSSVPEVKPEFVNNRLRDLGETYDTKIFNKNFDIDAAAAKVFDDAAAFEAQVNPAGSRGIKETAENLRNRWTEAKKRAEEAEMLGVMKKQKQSLGEVGEFQIRKFEPGERIDAPPLTPEIMRAYKIGNWNNVRPLQGSDVTWANDISKVVSDLSDKLGLRVKPGLYVGESSGGVQGLAGTPGHIILNTKYFKSGEEALSTVIHELGHQFEYQAFRYADQSTKNAIIQAWKKQNKGVLPGEKTVEQYRPITAAKYDPVTKQYKVMGQADDYSKYIRSFPEWFAEQVSRYITTKKEATTVVEKFFKGVADTWKKIYERVTGYTPLSKEVDDFMRANWDGKLLEDAAIREVFVPGKGAVVADPLPPLAGFRPEKVVAQIPGKELQTLLSNLKNIAFGASEGMVRGRARELINEINSVIEKSAPKEVVKLLEKTNKEYRATMTLREMMDRRDPSINVGYINPKVLNDIIASERGELTHPLAKYARLGRVLGYESPKVAEAQRDTLYYLLNRAQRLARYVGSPLLEPYERAIRNIQRGMEPGVTPTGTPPVSVDVGGRPVAVPFTSGAESVLPAAGVGAQAIVPERKRR